MMHVCVLSEITTVITELLLWHDIGWGTTLCVAQTRTLPLRKPTACVH